MIKFGGQKFYFLIFVGRLNLSFGEILSEILSAGNIFKILGNISYVRRNIFIVMTMSISSSDFVTRGRGRLGEKNLNLNFNVY